MGGGCDIVPSGEIIAGAEDRECLGIPLFHHAEAPELAFIPIEVAVVVGIAGDEAVAADAIIGLHPLDHMHGEWQTRDPWFPCALCPPGRTWWRQRS